MLDWIRRRVEARRLKFIGYTYRTGNVNIGPKDIGAFNAQVWFYMAETGRRKIVFHYLGPPQGKELLKRDELYGEAVLWQAGGPFPEDIITTSKRKGLVEMLSRLIDMEMEGK